MKNGRKRRSSLAFVERSPANCIDGDGDSIVAPHLNPIKGNWPLDVSVSFHSESFPTSQSRLQICWIPTGRLVADG
ncbi:hypothetical protein LSTR_LSTR014168 [Laodelphax striatellus]|uniref:Uncharacterized protein n=1 Tax=Laodelphax striatellus TaxID=195883 RepID=A0A482X1Z4_LAOST|nr:hypothetical protein LSTR_LSTR014168 [Laodelphax striatellus]